MHIFFNKTLDYKKGTGKEILLKYIQIFLKYQISISI